MAKQHAQPLHPRPCPPLPRLLCHLRPPKRSKPAPSGVPPPPITPRALQWWPGAKSDPYAVVSVGDSSAATSAITQTLEPQWGETFYLYVRWAGRATMVGSGLWMETFPCRSRSALGLACRLLVRPAHHPPCICLCSQRPCKPAPDVAGAGCRRRQGRRPSRRRHARPAGGWGGEGCFREDPCYGCHVCSMPTWAMRARQMTLLRTVLSVGVCKSDTMAATTHGWEMPEASAGRAGPLRVPALRCAAPPDPLCLAPGPVERCRPRGGDAAEVGGGHWVGVFPSASASSARLASHLGRQPGASHPHAGSTPARPKRRSPLKLPAPPPSTAHPRSAGEPRARQAVSS